ncbi:hypothetical protein CYMTET_44230 [Cymbomonas tetramitiformis]|uniref:Uncharacterized protein n=1 Tax=Cymbomonas tetramitiformis TaxID=36881 RepID=A0AAE0C1W3_9CHLO|nr:hypothetical protein CYMTET_44230 [Cymbomonas tetramitiformis]
MQGAVSKPAGAEVTSDEPPQASSSEGERSANQVGSGGLPHGDQHIAESSRSRDLEPHPMQAGGEAPDSRAPDTSLDEHLARRLQDEEDALGKVLEEAGGRPGKPEDERVPPQRLGAWLISSASYLLLFIDDPFFSMQTSKALLRMASSVDDGMSCLLTQWLAVPLMERLSGLSCHHISALMLMQQMARSRASVRVAMRSLATALAQPKEENKKKGKARGVLGAVLGAVGADSRREGTHEHEGAWAGQPAFHGSPASTAADAASPSAAQVDGDTEMVVTEIEMEKGKGVAGTLSDRGKQDDVDATKDGELAAAQAGGDAGRAEVAQRDDVGLVERVPTWVEFYNDVRQALLCDPETPERGVSDNMEELEEEEVAQEGSREPGERPGKCKEILTLFNFAACAHRCCGHLHPHIRPAVEDGAGAALSSTLPPGPGSAQEDGQEQVRGVSPCVCARLLDIGRLKQTVDSLNLNM